MVNHMGGFPPPIGMDPNAYAAQYAQLNGISIDEAKIQLRAQYGDPQQPQNFMQTGLQQFQQTQSSTSSQSGLQIPGNSQYPSTESASFTTSTTMYASQYSLTSTDEKKNTKYENLENKIESKFEKKGKINPTFYTLFDNSHRIVQKWVKSYMKEHNCSRDEAEYAFCQRFNCSLQKDGRSYAFVRN